MLTTAVKSVQASKLDDVSIRRLPTLLEHTSEYILEHQWVLD